MRTMIKYKDYIKQFGEQMSTELIILQKSKPEKNIFTEKITKSNDAFKYLMATPEYVMNIETKEMFYCIYVNRANKIQSIIKISEGDKTGCVVNISMILQGAILQGSSGIILSHNHPSGNNVVSEADKKITSNIKQVCILMGITLLDHIIVHGTTYTSLTEEGLI